MRASNLVQKLLQLLLPSVPGHLCLYVCILVRTHVCMYVYFCHAVQYPWSGAHGVWILHVCVNIDLCRRECMPECLQVRSCDHLYVPFMHAWHTVCRCRAGARRAIGARGGGGL